MTSTPSKARAPRKAASKAPEQAPVIEQAPEGALSVADLAEGAGVSQKDMRRWLRAQARSAGAGEALPGKGGRYSFTPAQAQALIGAYGKSKAQRGTQAPAQAILAALTGEGEASA